MTQATLEKLPFHNSNLFSAYYLSERLRDRSEWDCDDDAREVLDEITELYELEKDLLPSYKEDALIDSWIDEVLDILGYGTNVETTLPEGDGYVDVLLFEDTQTRRDAAEVYLSSNDTTDLFEGGISLLEAKQWDADFSKRFSENRPYYNASQQIRRYLDKTPSNIEWGILTNGRKWRLYGTKDHEAQIYYEVDLPELIEEGNLNKFKYFYLFFRPEAFRKVSGSTFLDTVWSESETATQELGDDLQDNVFRALRVLGHGIVETNDLDIDPDDEEALDELKEQSLVLLYRLMFVLYAESRQLIDPEGKQAQKEYEQNFSLNQHRLEIHDTIGEVDSGFEEEYSSYSSSLWSNLQDLFRLVDQGKESLGIPPYNGGLFDHDEHAFLTEHKVSDRHLAEVIYRLSTTENDEGRYVLADYGDLDTRHLGSVYEGLLEHQFRIAPEDYAAVAEDGGQVWKPATEVTVADAVETVEKGSLYVTNDKGERKATGAYYTPDYVVNYIVEETVGPLVEDIREDLVGQGFETGTQEYLGAFLRRVTQLKILDPAMGSGHFLTGATGYLAEQVMKEVREVEVEMGVAFNEQHVRREIAKECIYGVDINGMAVELAKLSMWLETLAADRPLAFLDHHLKAGNSLVGSDITEVLSDDNEEAGGQLTLSQSFARARQQTLEHVMELMSDLLAIDNERLEDIKSMEELYDEIRDDPLYQRLFEVANVHTAEQFGVDVPDGVYKDMAGAIDDAEAWVEIREEDWFASAQTLSAELSVFHWELEFPEVYFNKDGEKVNRAGFDAVVGNPPYVNMSNLSTEIQEYLSIAYNEVYSGNSDILYYFMSKSLHLAKENGMFGLIVSRYFIHAQYASDLRNYLLENGKLTKIVDFENYQAFPGVDVLADIVFCQNNTGTDEYNINVLKLKDDSVSESIVSKNLMEENSSIFSMVEMSSDNLSSEPWNLIDEATLNIKEKMEDSGIKLGNNYQVVQSMQTGHNESLVVSDEKAAEKNIEKELLKPLAKTKNIRRYLIKDIGSYIIWTEVDDIDKYPNAKDHLLPYKDELEKRYDIQSRSAEWWKISNPRNQDLFASDEPRILTPFMSTSNKFAVDTDQHFNDGGDIRAIFETDSPVDLHYTLSILNSTLGEFYHKNTAKLKRDGYYEYYGNAIEKFPIFDIDLNRRISELEIDTQFVADDSSIHSVLNEFAKEIRSNREAHDLLNLSVLDHLGSYDSGQTITEIGLIQPAQGSGDSVIQETTKQKPNLRIGTVRVTRENNTTVKILLSARYKPDDEDAYETDQWGYTETDLEPALQITDLTPTEADLIEAFVPVAVDEAGGFADFRETATKTNSLVDRLRKLTLPALSDVEAGLDSYIQTKERADELEEKIERTDELIDEIVYELYGLTDEEIEIVEEAVN